jgi:hypothetical protein
MAKFEDLPEDWRDWALAEMTEIKTAMANGDGDHVLYSPLYARGASWCIVKVMQTVTLAERIGALAAHAGTDDGVDEHEVLAVLSELVGDREGEDLSWWFTHLSSRHALLLVVASRVADLKAHLADEIYRNMGENRSYAKLGDALNLSRSRAQQLVERAARVTVGPTDLPLPKLDEGNPATGAGTPAGPDATTATVTETAQPCEVCGRPCWTRFGTVARHIPPCPPPPTTRHDDQSATGTPRRPQPPQRQHDFAAAVDRRPIVGRGTPPGTAPAISLETELANFTAIIRADAPEAWPGLDTLPARETLLAALDLFHRVTDHTQLQATSAGRMGILTFYRLAAKFGATPELGKVELPDALTKIRPKMLDPRWINPDRSPVIGGPPVIGLDVNGQFLAASSMELGTGAPRRLGATDAATMLTVNGKFRDIPGYGQLTGPIEGAPGILATLATGDWLAAPTLRYLADDLGLSVPLTDAWVFDEHRKWFNTSYEFWRGARAALLGGPPSPGTPFALAAVKAIPNAFFGGMVSSVQHNMTATMRPDWTHHVKARARVNALRNLRGAPVEPLAMAADTAYFLGMDETQGIPIPQNKALGKFKVDKVAEVTAEIVAAHASGRVNRFRDAVNAANNKG